MVVVMVVVYRFVNLLPTGAPKSFPDKNFCFYEALIYAILLYTPSLLLVIIIQGKHIIFIMQMRKQRLGVTISHYFCRKCIKVKIRHISMSFQRQEGLFLSHPLYPYTLLLSQASLLRHLSGWFFEPKLHTYFLILLVSFRQSFLRDFS